MSVTRFKTLDGARGVAAILVVLFHVAKVYDIPSPSSAYLAVDMFFALSGFVLARTYELRFEKGLTAYAFMKSRALRLYPLYFAGLMLGVFELTLMWRAGEIGLKTLSFSAVFGVFLLPVHVPFHPWRLFPSNGPAWSLFCEFWIANLAYAILWRFITPKRLVGVLALSAAALFALAWKHHSMDMGSTWGFGGVARVIFSFTAGIAVWRYYRTKPPKVQVPSAIVLLTLIVLLCWPIAKAIRPIYDFACVILAFPALIYFGAGAKERRPELGAIAGDLSYAVYVLHAPLLGLFARWQPAAGGREDYLVALVFTAAVMVIGLGAHRLDQALRRPHRITNAKSVGA